MEPPDLESMRVIKVFIISIIAILISWISFIFVGREFFLITANISVKSAYKTVSKNVYANRCYEEFGENQLYWTQIRFTSKKDYNLEVVCENFEQQPIVIEERKLPPFVIKSSNTSGLVLNHDNYPTYIDLYSFGREITLYSENFEFKSTYLGKPELDYSIGPPSQCEAVNYHCCLDHQDGLGQEFNQATDCPKSCYQTCLQRPILLSFNSSPPVEENRTVSIRAGEEVEFSYVISDSREDVFEGQIPEEHQLNFFEKLQLFFDDSSPTETLFAAKPIKTRIDYGDGSFSDTDNLQQSLVHLYTCRSSLCFYEAKVSSVDAKGVSTVETDLAKILVKVSNF